MIIEQKYFSKERGWQTHRTAGAGKAAPFQLVIAFGSRELLSTESVYQEIRAMYPEADIMMASTAGEILDGEVSDRSISLTALALEKSWLRTAAVHIGDYPGSLEAGKALTEKLNADDLVSILVLSDGHSVNGSDLVQGLGMNLPEGAVLTGGLAGDAANFEVTVVGLNEMPANGRIVAVGFYGKDLKVGYGSLGGWDPFGPSRLITRSDGNILYELDGKPALDTYKLYLGEYARELPASALHFPLSVQTGGAGHYLVRTILSVNEEDKSLTFAGNMPEGAHARLMKANADRLIEGASGAATQTKEAGSEQPDLAILISCVGRKLVLGQRVEEEVEAVRNIYGANTAVTGFYSYGEIAPSLCFLSAELHNQTMTITTLKENW